MSSNKLFIGGLPYGVDDQSLKDVFSGFGDVVDDKFGLLSLLSHVFANTRSNEIKSCIFDEFNSLSGVYQKLFITITVNEPAPGLEAIFSFKFLTKGLERWKFTTCMTMLE
ncbi:hypothetical protein JHK87_003881 [Glycine soja]|nr:hypothetical protein JHK87_003881 [Glycine soja]